MLNVLHRRAIFLCATLLVSSNSFAQNDATIETKVGQGQLIGILQVPSIQNDLRLTAEQVAKISEITRIPGAISFANAVAPLKTILSDEQLKEFKRNALPGLMVRAFTVSEVRDTLELTQEQVNSIVEIQTKLKTQLQPFQDKINQLGSPKNAEEAMQLERDTEQFHEDAYVEAFELLNDEQRKKWKEIAKPIPLRKKNGG